MKENSVDVYNNNIYYIAHLLLGEKGLGDEGGGNR